MISKILFSCSLLFVPWIAAAQSSSDSLAKAENDRFWSRSGGEARELSLGAGGFGMLGDSGVKTLQVNPFSVDPLFMLQNPAYASRYPSYLWFDAGATAPGIDAGIGESFGGTFAVSEDFTAGIVLARGDAVGFTIVNPNIFQQLTISTLAQNPNISYVPPQNTWQVMGSYLAGDLSIGAAISYASSSSSSGSIASGDTISSSTTFHQLGISAGAVWRAHDGNMLDLDLMELMPSVSTTGGSPGELSMNVFGMNARYFLPLRKEFYLVPMFDFYYASGSSTVISTPKDLPSSTNFDAGIGVNFWQGGLHVMSGVSAGFYNQTTPAVQNISPELSRSQTIVPRWTIGVEWPILHWLTARLGYFASSGNETDISSTGTSSTDTTSFGAANLYSPLYGAEAPSSGISVGVTFILDRFTIDATIHEDILRSGPLDINGSDIFSFVTLGYRFD